MYHWPNSMRPVNGSNPAPSGKTAAPEFRSSSATNECVPHANPAFPGAMSGYSYGHRSGVAEPYGGVGTCATNASAAARASGGHHSYGAMAGSHMPSTNSSASFGGNYRSDQFNTYQGQTQTQIAHMSTDIHSGNHSFQGGNMEVGAYNRQSNSAAMQQYNSASSSVMNGPPSRRMSVPPGVASNSYSSVQRSQSFPPPEMQYNSRNNMQMQQQSSYSSSYPNQSRQFGEGYSSSSNYNGQAQSRTQPPMAYRPAGARTKSTETWDRVNHSRMGQNAYSNNHMTSHFQHRNTNQHQHDGMRYNQAQASTQINTQQGYTNSSNAAVMHSSMDMRSVNDASSDFVQKSSQCVNTNTMMGQSYGSHSGMYNPASGPANSGMRAKMPNQRQHPAGAMFNNSAHHDGNQIPGSMQKLRHFGPMPNSSSGFSRTTTQMSSYGNATQNMMGASNVMNAQGGDWSSCSNAQQGNCPTQNTQLPTPVTNNVPFNGLPQQSNMQQQMNYNNMSGISSQRSQSVRNYPAAMPTNAAAVDNTGVIYGQNTAANAMHYNAPAPVCQETFRNQQKFETAAAAPFSSDMTATETEAMIQQLNQDRIFSAELEKLARLSRNPMAEDFMPDADAAPRMVENSMNAAATTPVSNAYPAQDSVDELIGGGNCVTGNAMACEAAPKSGNPAATGAATPYNNSQSLTETVNAKLSTVTTASAPMQNQTVVSMSSSQIQQEQQVMSSSAPQTPNSTVNIPTASKTTSNKSENSSDCSTNQDKSGENGDNAVQHLQRMTQSIKDKQDDMMKVASSQHSEYLSHSASDNYGTQNCIAALSAACRNIIADMDSSMPKQNSTQKVQSPLGGKKTSFDAASNFGSNSESLSGFGSGPPSVNNMVDHFIPPGNGNLNPSVPPCNMTVDNYATLPANYNVSMPIPDYHHGKYHDFLEQSVPMQMSGRRIDEKPRKGRRRKKSDEFSTEQLITGNIPPAKPKRKYRKRSTQNPPSVESMEGPLSVDNAVFTPLSESNSHHTDDIGYRSASQTPNSVHNSWAMQDNKMSCSDSISIAMSIAGGNQIEHVSQDLLDSVFSPDTTMSSTTNQEPVESGNYAGSTQESPPSTHSSGAFSSQGQSPLGPPPLNNNPVIGINTKRNMYPPQSNNTVSSTGDATSPFISTSTHSINGSTKLKDTEEAHPLEILQAQIKIQRKQFNLGDSQPSQTHDLTLASKNNVKSESSDDKTELPLPSDLDMDLLTSEETAWYLSEDQQKDGSVLWEELCPKGQTNTSSKHLLLAIQS